MAKGKADESTIENRVYLFKDLAAAWIAANPKALTESRASALRALADLAYASCVLADTEDLEARAVAEAIRQVI